jgi:Flp pilus assembly pilin Flp
MLTVFHSLTHETRGGTLIDYSLIAAIVAVFGLSAMRAIGVALI